MFHDAFLECTLDAASDFDPLSLIIDNVVDSYTIAVLVDVFLGLGDFKVIDIVCPRGFRYSVSDDEYLLA
jgi:hypothetical protein